MVVYGILRSIETSMVVYVPLKHTLREDRAGRLPLCRAVILLCAIVRTSCGVGSILIGETVSECG